MKIDNFDVPIECSVMRDFEGAWVNLQSVCFRVYCNAYELLLKTICIIRSANLTMDFYIYNANFDG